jgi:hypothetical protein
LTGEHPLNEQRQLRCFVVFPGSPAHSIIEMVPEKTILCDGGIVVDTTREALK